MTAGDDTRTDPAAGGTGLILFPRTDSLPAVWVGPVPATGLDPGDAAALLAATRPHSGRVVRIDTADDTAWMHGVVASDRSAALLSYVQLGEPGNDQPAALRIPGLDPRRRYQVSEVTPGAPPPRRSGLEVARLAALQVSGAALAEIGLAVAAQRPLTAIVILLAALPDMAGR